MNISEINHSIVEEISRVLDGISQTEASELQTLILSSQRIFVAGCGRSLLMIRGFAMRLMHLGLQAFVVGETVTPAITPRDLLIIASGSGETQTLCSICRKAQAVGSSIALITTEPCSSIGKMADATVKIPATTPKSGSGAGLPSIQPGASTFEQCLLIFCDSLILSMEKEADPQEQNSQLMKLHANLE